MSKSIFLTNSYPWLSQQLLAADPPDPATAVIVDSPREADLIIYPKTDRVEDGASDRLRDLSPRELLRTCVFSQLDEPFPWAPGVYASIPAAYGRGGFVGGFYVPHHHYEEGGIEGDLEAARAREPDLLWSFMGTIANHPIRERLATLDDERSLVRDTQAWSETVRWGWKSKHRERGRKAFADYAELLGRSTFVVCPRGRGPGSIRLFEALRMGRPPVIVSDDWLPPPFVDWDSCSIRVPEARLRLLPEILRERESEARRLGDAAREVWEQRFSPRRQLDTLVRSCLLSHKEAPNRLGIVGRACVRPQALRRGLRRVKQSARRTAGA